jgi:hypothetical protein
MIESLSPMKLVVTGLGSLVIVGCLDIGQDEACRPRSDEVAYQQGCLFGCPLDQPLLSGSHQRISLDDAGDVASVEVSSSDDSVAAFALERRCYCERRDSGAQIEIDEDARCSPVADKHCDNVVLVHARQAGEADFVLEKGEKTIERARVIVRDAASVRLKATYADRLGAESVSALALAAGEEAQLELELYDDEGRKLLASDAVSWSIDDDATATLTAWLIGSGPKLDAGTSVTLRAKNEGQTRLNIAVSGLERAFEVEVAASK